MGTSLVRSLANRFSKTRPVASSFSDVFLSTGVSELLDEIERLDDSEGLESQAREDYLC